MRPHGRARISRSFPQALAVCDRCGGLYNHADLHWSFDWAGPRLANQRILVCNTCDDVFFEHARTILIPADPIPIANPRPEFYVASDNPISPVSFDPLRMVNSPTVSANLGNLTGGGGLDAPFYGSPQKPSFLSALLRPSSSATSANWIAKNWSATPGLFPAVLPTVMSAQTTALRYAVAGFTAQAPRDQSFLGTSSQARLTFSGWDGVVWNTLFSGYPAGIAGETLTVTSSQLANTSAYYTHALSIFGDGTAPAAIASLQISANAEAVLSSAAVAPTAPLVSS